MRVSSIYAMYNHITAGQNWSRDLVRVAAEATCSASGTPLLSPKAAFAPPLRRHRVGNHLVEPTVHATN